jgi:hypothetical protein
MEIFETRNDMLLSFEKNLKIAELGVWRGDFSKNIYEICNPSELYLVDLYTGYFGSGDKDGNNYQYVQLEDEMLNLIKYFKDNTEVEVIKKSTTDFLLGLSDNYLDLVYIDADHSFDSVLNDLHNSYNKVKLGGLICGHDYVNGTEAKNAVDYFCNIKELKINSLTKDGCPSFCIIRE